MQARIVILTGCRRVRSIFIALIAVLSLLFVSCSDDEATKTYSNANYVYCYFEVLQYRELFLSMGNSGQYATVRRRVKNGVTKIEMTNSAGTTDYVANAINTNFGYGLGGLIVGSNLFMEPLAYDLACPNCNQAAYRLTVSDKGTAHCAHCDVTYDLNNYGVILTVPDRENVVGYRGLFRYRVAYNGLVLNVHN